MVHSPANPELPDVDDHIVRSEARYEILDGQVHEVAPADQPHGESHGSLAAIVRAHRGATYSVAVDMLTRTSKIDDIAPDVSVFPTARTASGGRQLEELAFEIASTEALSHAGKKAAKLVGRGVRRVFAIDLDRGRVVEWGHDLAQWSILDLGGSIIDPALAVPMPVGALLDAARSDDVVVRAFRARRHPEFLAEREEGRIEGALQGTLRGMRDVLVELLASRDLVLGEAERVRILAETDVATLLRWTIRAASCATIIELFEPR